MNAHDEVSGISAPVAVRTLRAAGANNLPAFILIGDAPADADTPTGAYRADGDKLFQLLRNALPAGTFDRLVVEYLRSWRRCNGELPDRTKSGSIHLDRCLAEVIAGLGEKFGDSDVRHLESDRIAG